MPVQHDPYRILGVPKDASQEQIKETYRNLAKKFHPDLNPGSKEAESRFKDVSQAYELIGTPEARAKFDRGEQEEAQGGRGGPEFWRGARGPFYRQTQEGGPEGGGRYTFTFGEGADEDLFESIFGAMGGAGRGAGAARTGTKGGDQLYRMEIGLRDAVHGAEQEIALPNGKRLAVKIPAGVSEGTRLRFSGQGAPGIGGAAPGDAYVEIHIREDDRFRREGDDLVLELPVSLTEAVFGGEVRAPTIDGEVMLKVPPRSNTGTRLKLAGKGLHNRHTGRRGNQLVVLRVMLPETIDPELESALRAWQGRYAYDPRQRGAA